MAQVEINLKKSKGKIERNIFGHFCEHAFGNIYGGLYDPENQNAGADGLREDVIALLKKVQVPMLRYPGGNFVSNYHWEDGIGPKSQRRRMFEYAWLTEESNQFGTADMIELCRRLTAEPYFCVNMGSGTAEEAMHWVEYCNSTANTYYANLRRQHGYEEPFHVKYWGLGNEMYGDWQMEYKSAEDYAKRAVEFAKAMKWVDPSIKLVACGYEQDADWNYIVMKRLGCYVDYLSAHHYSIGWGPFEANNYTQSMYVADYMERLNELTMSAVRSATNDLHTKIKVAWDEWNLFGWLVDGVNDDRTYTLQDAIVTALVLNMFLRNCDTIGIANYSTFVNINGAVSVNGDDVVTRPQYHVFDLLGNHTGKDLYGTEVYCDTFEVEEPYNPKMERPRPGNLTGAEGNVSRIFSVPELDAVATGEENICYLSLVNKSLDHDREVEVALRGGTAEEVELFTIYHEDVAASNTLQNPDNVRISRESACVEQGAVRMVAKKHSVNLLKIKWK